MRQVRAWAAACALLTVSVTGSAQGDEPGLFSRMFGSEEKSEPEVKSETTSPAKGSARPTPPPDPKAEAAEHLRIARDELTRRLELIDHCRLLALGRPDEADLLKRLDDMENQAMQVYDVKISHLPVARLQPARELDSRLGQGVAVNPLTSTQQPIGTPPMGSASLDRGSFQGGNR